MNKIVLMALGLLFIQGGFAATEGTLKEGLVNPGYYEKPEWFKQSFLDLREDLDDARENNKRVMLYFHQDGCPYCKKLLNDNFTRNDIVDTMKQHYDLLAINMWGDKTVTLLSGQEKTEKAFARQLKVMFTPTLIVLDDDGTPLFRMNGYYDPERFSAVLDYLRPSSESQLTLKAQPRLSFNEFYQQRQLHSKKSQSTELAEKSIKPLHKPLHREGFIVQSNDLQAVFASSMKPLMILFEQGSCSACDELHGDVFRRLPVYKKLKQFTIVQIDINSTNELISPDGHKTTHKEWAKSLNIQYTPSILFYEPVQRKKQKDWSPVFRSEAYLKGFHIQALFDYITSGAYMTEPEFQRFVQKRADKMREEGIEVDLWD